MAGKRKLNEQEVNAIRYLVNVEHVSLRQVAKSYDISHVHAWRIARGIQRA